MKAEDIVVCPECKGELEITSEDLHCPSCDLNFEITDGVPIMASDEEDVFDARWVRNQKPQATDQWWKALWGSEYPKGKLILDGGCGIGRYAQRAIQEGASVIGLDISPAAIAATKQNAPGAICIQGSLLGIPLPNNFVDAAYSIGVLHHTPDPEIAFRELVRVTKPGGLVAVWVYAYASGSPEFFPVADMLHEITRACPKDKLYEVFKKYAPRIRDIYHDRWEPLMQVLRVSISKNDEECTSDSFDWHGPRYRSRHSEEEVKDWFVSAGCEVLKVGAHQTNVLGRKL